MNFLGHTTSWSDYDMQCNNYLVDILRFVIKGGDAFSKSLSIFTIFPNELFKVKMKKNWK